MDISKIFVELVMKSLEKKKTVRSIVKKKGYKPLYRKVIRVLRDYFRCRYFIKEYYNIKEEEIAFKKYLHLKKEVENIVEFQKALGKDISQKYSFPPTFVSEVEKLLNRKKPVTNVLDVLNLDPYTFVRINTIKLEKEIVKKIIEKYLDLEETNVPNLFKVRKVKNRRIFDLIRNMHITTTDYSSLKAIFSLHNFIKEYFGERRKLRVLDACASPGAKATYLYELNKDLEITCVEKNKLRYFELVRNLSKYGIKLKSLNKDFLKIRKKNYFDIIILDVPCSNSGTVGKFPEIRYFYGKKDIKHLFLYQKKLLLHAISLNPSVIFYSTCSLFHSENTKVLDGVEERFNFSKIKDKDLIRVKHGYLVDIEKTRSTGFFFTILHR